MDHLVPRMVHPHNSESAVRIVLQFCTMKEVKRDMEIILFFPKNLIQSNLVILAPKWYDPITLDLLSGFFY